MAQGPAAREPRGRAGGRRAPMMAMMPLRRTLLLAGASALALLGAGPVVEAQPRRIEPRGYLQLGPPDAEVGRRALEEFRASRLPAGFYLAFELRWLPRRGEPRTVPGRMWGMPGAAGPLTLVVLDEGRGDAERRLLLRGGPRPELWLAEGEGAEARPLRDDETFAPLAGMPLTPFGLLLPFVHWDSWDYEGLERVAGRPAHAFLFAPPEGFPVAEAGFAGVRAWLDGQFGAPTRVSYLDAEGQPVRTMSTVEVSKVGEHWIVRTLDVRDEVTRDKARLEVRAAATGLAFDAGWFEPAQLGGPLPAVPEGALEVLP